MAEVDVSKNKNKNKNKDTTTNKPDKTRNVQKLRTPIKIPVFGKMDKFQQGQARLNQAISRFDTAAKKQLGSAMKPSSASSGILQKIKKEVKDARKTVVDQQQQKKQTTKPKKTGSRGGGGGSYITNVLNIGKKAGTAGYRAVRQFLS
tara:strand:+ start:4163 stop:4606 length:444 start_codon:yes stop_codon:yes gene_type:complete